MIKINLAQTYLGNYLKNLELQQQVEVARALNCCLDVELKQDDQLKSRIYTKSVSGEAIGIVKQRDWTLTDGDVFKTKQQQLLVVHLEAQQLMVLSFLDEQPRSPLTLIHLGHTLGNHHYPILVAKDKIYVQLVADRASIEATIQNFNIPGLKISYETRAPARQVDFTNHSHRSHHHSYVHPHQ